MSGRIYAGTSGFSYKEWKPDFYPAEVKQADFLRYYATRLPSVEINNTFYRSPSEKLLSGWVEKTPAEFRFTLKAPRSITHIARLADVDERLSVFLSAAKTLGDRLGAILFQCPPTLQADVGLLKAFVASLPGSPFRFALEFRHESWDTDEVRDLLASNGVALCVAETEGELPLARTARAFSYVRLRKDAYPVEDLERWAEQMRAAIDDGADLYVYFKHEDDVGGVNGAMWLRDRLGSG